MNQMYPQYLNGIGEVVQWPAYQVVINVVSHLEFTSLYNRCLNAYKNVQENTHEMYVIHLKHTLSPLVN
jgi:hypothetical protein